MRTLLPPVYYHSWVDFTSALLALQFDRAGPTSNSCPPLNTFDNRWYSTHNRNRIRLYDIKLRPSSAGLPVKFSPETPKLYRGKDPVTVKYQRDCESRYLWPGDLLPNLACDNLSTVGVRLKGIYYHPKEIRLNLGSVHLSVITLSVPFLASSPFISFNCFYTLQFKYTPEENGSVFLKFLEKLVYILLLYSLLNIFT